MKIKTTIDPRVIAARKPAELFKQPIIIQVNNFNTDAAETFVRKIHAAEEIRQPVIPVVIDSPGGEVYSLMRMLSAIEGSKIPVATISSGKSMSCGCILLSAGTPGYRYVDPNSTIMLHDVSSGKIGKSEDLKVSAAEADRLKKSIFHKMAKYCDQPKNYFIDILSSRNNTDYYMSPQTAKKHRIVDHIGVPEFRASLDVNYEFIG